MSQEDRQKPKKILERIHERIHEKIFKKRKLSCVRRKFCVILFDELSLTMYNAAT